MREDIDLCNFTAGELSPKLKGRTDYERYFDGAAAMLNMVALPQGGATRRPGTLLAGLAKDQGGYQGSSQLFRSRLVRFVFSAGQAYMLEFTALNVRIYANDGVVLNGGVPVDVATAYQTAELAALAFTQSADTLFICHPSHALSTLTRTSDTGWTYTQSALNDGPYLDLNTTATTLTPSGTSGAITLHASSIVGINVTPSSTGQGFLAGDVGRLVRLRLFSLWAWLRITSVDGPQDVHATVLPRILNHGAWGAIDGAPWAANTRYPAGATVKNGSLYYIVTSAGVSGNGHGPNGTGSNIVDGSVTWSLAGPFNAVGYSDNTIWACGDICQNPPTGGTYYECIQGGDSLGSGGPTGSGVNQLAGKTIWMDIAPFQFPAATTFWQLGKYSVTTGFPYLCTFWQGRLALLGTNNQPNAVEGSVSNDFTNFAPTEADGTLVAANALSWLINDEQVNAARWVTPAGSSVAMQLGIGTAAGETIMQPATNSEALSPTNVQVYRETAVGSAANVPALRIGKSVLFANRPGRKLMDWVWQWALNGYLPVDRTVDADHITAPATGGVAGIVMMAWQAQPYGIVWCVLGDGSLIGLTYLPEQKVIAWHRHKLGGQYYGAPPIVESIAVIPSPDGSYDELWLTVVRGVWNRNGGAPWRSVEVMTRFFDAPLLQEHGCFMDCAIASATVYPVATLSGDFVNGGAVQATAAVFTAASVGAYLRVSNGVLRITAVADPQNATAAVLVPAINAFWAESGQWSLTPQYTGFSGFLAQQEGDSVQLLGDGADLGSAAIAGGAIAVPNGQSASYLIAGLAYTFDLVTMPWAPSRALPVPAAGKSKKLTDLYLRLHQSLGLSYGRRETDPLTFAVTAKLDRLTTRSSGDALGAPPALFSGLRRLALPGGFDQEGQIEITGSGPYPCTVLSICASADVGGT